MYLTSQRCKPRVTMITNNRCDHYDVSVKIDQERVLEFLNSNSGRFGGYKVIISVGMNCNGYDVLFDGFMVGGVGVGEGEATIGESWFTSISNLRNQFGCALREGEK